MRGWLASSTYQPHGRTVVAATPMTSFQSVYSPPTTVRPWGWYVLLASQPLLLVWAVVYTIAFGSGRTDVVIIFVLATVSAVLGFAYFYKRRPMFGATWRWRGLERWLPGWARSESIDPVVRRGFAGLSPVRRRVFIAATLLVIVIELLAK